MPDKYDELKSSIAVLAQNTEDPEVLKTIGSINQRIDDLKRDEDSLIQKHDTLLKDYRDRVISETLLNGKESKSDPGDRDRAPRSIDQIFRDVNEEFKSN